jgi:UDP-glucuronate 4-epimerase
MKKILVTGGAGFIGSHLCEALVTRGHAVVAVDNFDPMYPRAEKERNLSWLRQQPNFTLIEADIRDVEQMEAVFRKDDVDRVFHLAGRGGIAQSNADPFFYLDEILRGTLVILECSARHGVGMIVNAGSSSVYATSKGKASKESDDTDRPASVYSACKKSAELLCHAYHVIYGVGVVNVRFFSVYGPRGRPDMVIYKVTKKIMAGEPILEVQPDPVRDFTYVSDIVDGLLGTLEVPRNTYEVINLGYGRPVPVSKSIKMLEKELGKNAVRGERVLPALSDVAMSKASSARARQLLHWQPKVRLEEGLKRFVEWYRDRFELTPD